MARPIQKRWFGPTSNSGQQIIVNGVRFADGTTATNAYIVSQTGSSAYVVSNGVKAEICFMVNANGLGALLPSQCYITATPFGGTPLPCKTIAQYRAQLFLVPNSVARTTGDPAVQAAQSYRWSQIPAVAAGQCDLNLSAAVSGAILSVAMGNVGAGYFTAPAVSFTGGGVGATGTAVLSNGTVTGVTVNTGGSGYATGAMTLGAPPAAVTATAGPGTATAGVVDLGPVVFTAGGYYTTAPVVTVVGGDGLATATATVSAGQVTSVTVTNGGLAGYVTPVLFTIAAPPAAVQATATATVSV